MPFRAFIDSDALELVFGIKKPKLSLNALSGIY